MVLLRIVWGFVGTRWARFSSFVANPKEVFSYVAGSFTGRAKRYAGHNPGSSLATILMFALLLGLAVTGLMMKNGFGGEIEELHELIAWTMVAVIAAHLAGIAWHSIRHRENISLSMVNGRKQADPAAAIPSTRPIVGLVFVILTTLWTLGLVNGYDATTGRVSLPLIGDVAQIGEEHEHSADGSGTEREHQERGHSDD